MAVAVRAPSKRAGGYEEEVEEGAFLEARGPGGDCTSRPALKALGPAPERTIARVEGSEER